MWNTWEEAKSHMIKGGISRLKGWQSLYIYYDEDDKVFRYSDNGEILEEDSSLLSKDWENIEVEEEEYVCDYEWDEDEHWYRY